MSDVAVTEPRFDALPREVRASLGYYVYLYADPETGEPFYVGKGVGERVLAHQDVVGECDKARRLEAIRERGLRPRLVVVRHGMTESEALVVEAVLIEHIGLDRLTNKVAGHGTSRFGRMSLEQVRSRYAAEPVHEFAVPTLLFRLSRSFRYTMAGEEASERDRLELYEATRGTWKLGAARKDVKLAMAVYDNVVQEVYEISGWQHGGTARYETREIGGVDRGRWEFVGERSEDARTRESCIGRDVKHLFPRGFTGSFRYVWPSGEERCAA